jgi:transposase
MTDTQNEEQLLKTDVLGRVHMPRERREMLLDEFEKSGASGMAFAKLVGVNYQTFAGWLQKRRRERKQYPAVSKTSPKTVSKVQWLEAVVEQKKLPSGSKQSVLMVHLPGGARMEIADATQAALAAALLRSLENQPALSC